MYMGYVIVVLPPDMVMLALQFSSHVGNGEVNRAGSVTHNDWMIFKVMASRGDLTI